MLADRYPGHRAPVTVRSLPPRRLAEFEAMCRFICTAPQSPFTHGSLCSLATTYGRVTLTGTTLTTTVGEQVTRQELSESEARQALAVTFGIEDEGLPLLAGSPMDPSRQAA